MALSSSPYPTPLCENFLNGFCAKETCAFSHDVGPHFKEIWDQRINNHNSAKMNRKPYSKSIRPRHLCYKFVYSGDCSRPNCPLEHNKAFQVAYRKDKSLAILDPVGEINALMERVKVETEASHTKKKKPKMKKNNRHAAAKPNHDSLTEMDSLPTTDVIQTLSEWDPPAVMTDSPLHFPVLSKAHIASNPYGWDSSRLQIKPNLNAKKSYVVSDEMVTSSDWCINTTTEWPVDPLVKGPQADEPNISSESCFCFTLGSERCEAHRSYDPETCEKVAAHVRCSQQQGEKMLLRRPPSKMTEKFTLFSELPYEIRLQIWEYAVEEMLKTKWERVRKVCVDRNSKTCKLVSHSPLPSLLEACQLSRKVALKMYKVAFDTKKARNRIYFNFKTDILFICNESYEDLPWMARNFFPHDFRRIARLRLPLRDLVLIKDTRVRVDFYRAVARFSGLVDLRLLVSNSPDNEKYWNEKKRLAREKEVKQDLDLYWMERYKRKGPVVRITAIRADTACAWGIDRLTYYW
ncbi:hypothetical protein B7463_g6390, partial [Scytalidium lignicola]